MSDCIGRAIDRYHILEQLGQGGMAVVYKAFDTRSERDVAFKIIRSESFAPDVISRIQHRFKREVQTLMRLSHPNIVQILDSGEYEGSPYMVMPLLPGGTLKQKLGSPMPYQQAAGILLPIAQALAHAHQNSVIHRDVKPSNILFTADGQPMLTDFGVVKIIENTESQTLTGTGVGIGTPEYMAPEQWTGEAVPHSDIYSLGVVFYEMVTGRKPYTADTPAAILLKQAVDPLPRPRSFAPSLSDTAEKIIFKVLAKKPEDRYQDMQALAVALDKLIPRAKPAPPPKVEKLGKVKTPRVKPEKSPRERLKPVHKRNEDFTTDLRAALTKPSTRKRAIPKALIGMGIIVLVGLGITGAILLLSNPSAASLAQGTPAEMTIPVTPTSIGTPTQTITPAPTFTVTPTQEYVLPADYVPITKVTEDGMIMILIPSIYGQPAFWIDKTEVTIGMYKQCVNEGVCKEPINPGYKYGIDSYSNYPISSVTYTEAEFYCHWLDKDLPKNVEWETAAGGYDGRRYPWGDEKASGYANINLIESKLLYPVDVRSYQGGSSPFGVMNMIGNVSEWIADIRFVRSEPYHLLKGGSSQDTLTSISIGHLTIGISSIDTGFRCVMPADR